MDNARKGVFLLGRTRGSRGKPAANDFGRTLSKAVRRPWFTPGSQAGPKERELGAPALAHPTRALQRSERKAGTDKRDRRRFGNRLHACDEGEIIEGARIDRAKHGRPQ